MKSATCLDNIFGVGHLFVVFGLLAPNLAQADTGLTGEYAAVFNESIQVEGNSLTQFNAPGTYSQTSTDSVSGATSTGSATLQVMTTPSANAPVYLASYLAASVQQNIEDGYGLGASATSSLQYYFEVVGPANPGFVLDVNLAGGATNSDPAWGAATALAQVAQFGASPFLNLQAGQLEGQGHTIGPLLPNGLSFSVNQAYTISTNTIYVVRLAAYAEIDEQSDGQDNVSNSAYADPTFAVDPSNPNASEYSIDYSSDLTAVPEPSSWALGVIALGTVFYLSRRALRA